MRRSPVSLAELPGRLGQGGQAVPPCLCGKVCFVWVAGQAEAVCAEILGQA